MTGSVWTDERLKEIAIGVLTARAQGRDKEAATLLEPLGRIDLRQIIYSLADVHVAKVFAGRAERQP